ncbi:MAG TPA: UDP-N-acetylmuramoyl-L-alanine--D-glutamate ligase, partial [Thermomicrobiales bacterium]|nr:UDP-N-acetylmuramoyl-L-alanine--D-glutamate ligase [Thermomicrobiales bacterium]
MGELTGKRVTVMGLGTRGGGLGVARWLVAEGAVVTVTDAKPAEALTEPLADLAGLPIRFVLGRHDEAEFSPVGADLVVRNPAVRRDAPLLRLARESGVPVEMEISLFLAACPAPVVGVTGTKGKTTVSTLCAEMLRRWKPETVLAGNMGISALESLPPIGVETPVVLEISSWQLEAAIEHGKSPHVAVLTNVAEDHLNTYRDFAEYADTKRGITAHQGPEEWLVVNRDDPECWRATAATRARVVPFGLVDPGGDGAWLAGNRLVWRLGAEEWSLPRSTNAVLRGDHGAANALAALAAARLRGAPVEAIAGALEGFTGVKDRMEPIAVVDGVAYVNDTTATAPLATAAALDALAGQPVRLLAGGADKGLDPAPIAAAVAAPPPRPAV